MRDREPHRAVRSRRRPCPADARDRAADRTQRARRGLDRPRCGRLPPARRGPGRPGAGADRDAASARRSAGSGGRGAGPLLAAGRRPAGCGGSARGACRVPSRHRRPLSPWAEPFAAPLERRELDDPLPAGEDFALDPDGLPGAARLRQKLVGQIPVAGFLQYAPALHEGMGDVYDEIEQGLEDHGRGAFRPVVSLARIPHESSGVLIGEDSMLGQTVSALDRSIANFGQTGQEVLTEIGDGDLSGAIRAGERGLYRNIDIGADLLTASPVPAAADAVSDIIGTGADMAEPITPEGAQLLRDAEETIRGHGESWERGQEQLTDPEFYYDLRRRYVPMPWDPQG